MEEVKEKKKTRVKKTLTSVSSNTGLSLVESKLLSVFELGLKLPASIHSFFQSLSVRIDLFSAKENNNVYQVEDI